MPLTEPTEATEKLYSGFSPVFPVLSVRDSVFETRSLTDAELYASLHSKIEMLGKKINRFIGSVEKDHLGAKVKA